jgi:hypothetical protein
MGGRQTSRSLEDGKAMMLMNCFTDITDSTRGSGRRP